MLYIVEILSNIITSLTVIKFEQMSLSLKNKADGTCI